MASSRARRFKLGVAILCGACSTTPASTDEPVARSLIGPTGGTVSAGSGAAVEIPAGALKDSITITVANGEAAAGLPEALASAGPAVVFGPEGQTFQKPVTVTLPATRPATGMYTRPLNGSVWTALEGATYDAARSVVVARTDHFSVFVAVGPGSPHVGGGPASGGRKIRVTAEGVRVIGFFHFAKDPQGLCLNLEQAPQPIPSSYLLDIDCPGKCEYDLPPSGQVNGCLRALAPGDGTFGGTWSGDCTKRIYPDVPWPEYGVIQTSESRDLTCAVRP